MTLHPAFLAELLDDEVALARQRLGDRAIGLNHDGRNVTCELSAPDGSPVWLRLDAAGYDAEPVRVDVCDETGAPVPETSWPRGLSGGPHPVTGKPFVCIQGIYEYYTHFSHHKERWDMHRPTHRIPEVVAHLLKRAQQ